MPRRTSFADEIIITVASGSGGAGAASFRREKYVPRGGPDGGDGGKGGDILFKVLNNLKTLTHLRSFKIYRAGDGQPGAGRKRHGKNGNDLVILLPPGTQVKNGQTGEQMFDFLELGSETVFLHGGIGGKGNVHFATSRNRAPRFSQPGMPGTELVINLELSIIADIGFVGFPNAGKSSLLSVLTAARPEVADYPFTTKIPNLGVLRCYDHDIILADIPGIIEGASQGAGLGTRFLKHISRTAVLLFLIDLSDNNDPVDTLSKLRHELMLFEPELLKRRQCVIATKFDILEVREAFPAFEQAVCEEVIPVSSATREGLDRLTDRLFEFYSRAGRK